MAVYLVQHGKYVSSDLDPEKSLSSEGINEVLRIAETAKSNGVQVSCIQHSGKKRARQTAEIMCSILNPGIDIEQRDGINPLDDVIPVARKIDSVANTMLVGHLPFMERLAAYLITGIAENPVFKFQNGGILCLEKPTESRTWIIKWALVPVIK